MVFTHTENAEVADTAAVQVLIAACDEPAEEVAGCVLGEVYARISQMASQIWYTAVGSILGEAGFARFSRDDVRNTLWVRAFRMPYVSVSTPP